MRVGKNQTSKGFGAEQGNLNKHSKLNFNYKCRIRVGFSVDTNLRKRKEARKGKLFRNFLIEKWILLFVFNLLFICPSVHVYSANQFAKGTPPLSRVSTRNKLKSLCFDCGCLKLFNESFFLLLLRQTAAADHHDHYSANHPPRKYSIRVISESYRRYIPTLETFHPRRRSSV